MLDKLFNNNYEKNTCIGTIKALAFVAAVYFPVKYAISKVSFKKAEK